MSTVRCNDCGKFSTNEFVACAGACAEEREQNVHLVITGTQHLASCNCCDACREKCFYSWQNQQEEELKNL